MEKEEPPTIMRELFSGENIPGKYVRGDTDDYLGFLAREAKKAKAMKMEDQPPIMPPVLEEEEAFRLTVQTSEPQKVTELVGHAVQLH
jgi:hypothetical protein